MIINTQKISTLADLEKLSYQQLLLLKSQCPRRCQLWNQIIFICQQRAHRNDKFAQCAYYIISACAVIITITEIVNS